jgi:hypothetical protein
MEAKKPAGNISVITRTIDLLLIAYFAMSLDMLMVFPDIQIQMVRVLRPFVSVFIPVYNIIYTVISLLFLGIVLFLMIMPRHMDEAEIIRYGSVFKPVKGTVSGLLSLISSVALVWVSWSYGAHYMAFIVFARIVINRLYSWALNRFIETMIKKAVQMVDRGKA